ncbi:MAG: membrane protein insertion efficiency factor YidD [Cyanobacteria bacterium HKST-UBA06]|nr:membrane protein insertion efficiency factor YidD [Cyanobacteria bacterium HKST-UBA04]MCA9806434.1 membrane protein insertion efficiency factor YidD [Cyanobacteria bacterium HKST-UBA06]MCA9840562.1 membrane protein insertion efficiency factor YidD [Cyanobacteria bacterium HKST-UBA03]
MLHVTALSTQAALARGEIAQGRRHVPSSCPSLRLAQKPAADHVAMRFGCNPAPPPAPGNRPGVKLTDVDWNDPKIKQADAMTKALLWGIRQYQLWTRKPADAHIRWADIRGREHEVAAQRNWFGKTFSERCPHNPSCSQYGVQALLKYGWKIGFLKTAKRVLWDCNPISHLLQGKTLKEISQFPPQSIDDPV